MWKMLKILRKARQNGLFKVLKSFLTAKSSLIFRTLHIVFNNFIFARLPKSF